MTDVIAATATAQGRSVTVPFHGANLFVVEHNGEPYTPMKPVVEGAGLTWHGQHAKLKANQRQWGVLDLRIPSAGGAQEMICIPLRKLPGWLMTIDPGRLKSPEVRARVVEYQNECDDVLWQYWNEGVAINPRAFVDQPDDLLTGTEQQALRAIVTKAIANLPKEKQGGAAIKMWSKLKAHFKVGYRQIPREEFAEAVSLLTRASVEWEVVEEPDFFQQFTQAFAGKRLLMRFEDGRFTVQPVADEAAVMTPKTMPDLVQDASVMSRDQVSAIATACLARLSQGMDVKKLK